MNEYIIKANKLINEIKEEYTSGHEVMTKILNYQYFMGKLHAVYEEAEKVMDFEDFRKVYEHRKEERGEIDKLFNDNLITPAYKKLRR